MQATLNLAKGFGQCGDSLEFKTSIFPAGEMYFNCVVPHGIDSVRINTRANHSNDIMTVLLACDSLVRQGVRKIELFMPYLPYARQDRICTPGDSFSLSMMCALLRALQVRLVSYDVHSNVAEVLLDGMPIRFYNNHREVFDFINYLDIAGKHKILVVPDAGARKKAEALMEADQFGFIDGVVYANKKRVSEHVITVQELDTNLRGCVAIVVDDICDGGGTFNALGHRLQEAGCEEAYLFVSHGIFSKGTEELLKFYKKIGTTNSWFDSSNIDHFGVKRFKLDY